MTKKEHLDSILDSLIRGFDELEAFWDVYAETSILSNEEADLMEKIRERTGGYLDGYAAAVRELAELESKEDPLT